MKLTTTFKLLRKAGACTARHKFLRAALKGVKDTEPINLLTILRTNGIDDALWALRATKENCDKLARLMAADFAEEVLPIWHKHYPSDNRPAGAIKAARDFANNLITAEQVAAAQTAAQTAARAAAQTAARAAARAAAEAAAEAAAAEAAAQTAAWAATWDATWAAAGAAAWTAWAAAWEKQVKIFAHHLREE